MSYKAYRHEIRETCYEQIVSHGYKGKAAKEGVVSDEATSYFGFFVESQLVAFVGYMKVGKDYRFKSDWVHPMWRRQGIYQLLFTRRTEHVAAIFKGDVTAYCTNMSLPMYLKNGFVKKSEILRGKSGGKSVLSTYVIKTI